MDKERRERLIKKYENFTASRSSSGGAGMTIGRGGGQMAKNAMGKHGKPKNAWHTLVKLLNYISKQKVLFIIALVFAIVHAVSNLAASYMLRPIMNNFLYHDANNPDLTERISGLTKGLAAMAVVYAISLVSQWAQQRIMLTVSQRSLKQMRSDLFHKLQKLPVRYYDTNSNGDIMSRFANDVDSVGQMLNTTLIQILSGAITIVGTLILMVYTNWILGMITLIMTPILTLITKTIMKVGRSAYKKQQKNLGMLNGFAEETITGTAFETQIKNTMRQRAIAKECAEWIKQGHVVFRSSTKSIIDHGFAIVQPGVKKLDTIAYTPLRGFTSTDLGSAQPAGMMNLVQQLDSPYSKEYLRLFNEAWTLFGPDVEHL